MQLITLIILTKGIWFMKTLTIQEMHYVSGAGFFDSGPGWGATIGGTIGSRFGVLGGLAGAGIGHVIETTDYNAWGRNYTNSVMSDINSGNIPAD